MGGNERIKITIEASFNPNPNPSDPVFAGGHITFQSLATQQCTVTFITPTGSCRSFIVPAMGQHTCSAGNTKGIFEYRITPSQTLQLETNGTIIIVDPPRPEDDQGEDDDAQGNQS